MTERCQLLVECLDLPQATGVDSASWEHFQLVHLNDDSKFRIERKSRQIAWSWTVAAEAVAEAALYAQSSLFVSINLDEAKEKIRYARTVYDNLQGVRLPKLKSDTKTSLELENGARLLSLPAKAPRGKPRFNVYLDEFAHVQHDEEIYTGALPVTTKGGRIRIGSSTMGASGKFWEIFQEPIDKYPRYGRKTTPWWEVQALCTDVRVARREAPAMTTAERVERFGTESIRQLSDSMPLEDFQQEFECIFVDEASAWITWSEIKANQLPELKCVLTTCKGAEIGNAVLAIRKVQGMIERGEIEDALALGVDVGRTRDATELYFIGKGTAEQLPLRLGITCQSMPFDEQEEVLSYALGELPITAALIDQNGIGRNLTESLVKRFPAKIQGAQFTNSSKQLWATDAKMLVQKHRTPLPTDRDLAYQIHSIKRKVTASNNLQFDTERNEKHHADKFWAWVLGLAAANAKKLSGGAVTSMRDEESTDTAQNNPLVGMR